MANTLSQISAIVTATAAILAAVPGVQRVHTFMPVATQAGAIPETMGESQDIHYWTVRPESTQRTRQVGYVVQLNHVLVLRHYSTLGDPAVTTPDIDALIRRVEEVFDQVFSLPDEAAELYGPVQTTWGQPHSLADTFVVHYVELRLGAQELLALQ